MPVIIHEKSVILDGVCTTEDAEPLMQWLLAHPGGKVQLKDCTNMHSSVLQSLMAGQVQCVDWTADSNLTAWLVTALQKSSAD